ncbi:hypothetical protein TYRP_016158 [Tyrophagus putrescentiae]|nr:hypothetical protein TYRP_016158 [Tyrophagus putrescentiae]
MFGVPDHGFMMRAERERLLAEMESRFLRAEPSVPPSASSHLEKWTEAEKKLSTDMKALQFEGHFADVIFHFENDGTSVRAHKAMLAARSPVFADMFLQGGDDSKKKNEELGGGQEIEENEEQKKVHKYEDEDGITHVTITSETASDVFQHLLLYIYTGQLSAWKLGVIAADLLVVAHKYKVKTLKSLCEEAVLRALPVDCKTYTGGETAALKLVTDSFQLADATDTPKLKAKAALALADFMKLNISQIAKKKPEDILKMFSLFPTGYWKQNDNDKEKKEVVEKKEIMFFAMLE